MESTLIILKPDCVKAGLCGTVLSRFEKEGFTIAAMKMVRLSRALLEEHYSHLSGKPFFPSLLEFMSSTPVIVAVLKRENAVEKARQICGKTNPAEAAEGTIRRQYGSSVQANIIHASDSLQSAEREIRRFFKPEEICA
ncbi:MAG: nucleoside-diphosphate kinase [Candidatus Micrarchaeota archaeon]|nr:nucleoside-diphosphate kinase [Candidatus Micrarchaeota archaeon]